MENNKEKNKKSQRMTHDKEGGDALKANSLLSVYILEILRKDSNEKNPLTEKKLKEKINESEYFDEIPADDRKIIPRHINGLMRTFPTLIVKKETPRNHAAEWYYDKNRASSRRGFSSHSDFTAEEISFIIDMINSSKIITQDSNSAFKEKLLNLLCKEDKEIVESSIKQYGITFPKNDNAYVHSIFVNLRNFIRGKNTIHITVNTNGNEDEEIQDASVYEMYTKNGKAYIYISAQNSEREIEINNIKNVKQSNKKANYDNSIIDKLDAQDLSIISYDEDEDSSLNLRISNDTFFINSNRILSAIREKKYLTFNDYKCDLTRYEEGQIRTVIPLTTIFKNGTYYLIALEKMNQTEKSVFVRIDIMENVKLGDALSDEDREKIDGKSEDSLFQKDSDICSKINLKEIEFYIEKDAIQRAADEFGTQAEVIEVEKEDCDPLDTTGELLSKIGKLDPEFFTESFTGFEYGSKLIKIKVQSTEEDAIRWALENADIVELIKPRNLRSKMLRMAEMLKRRYSKSESDTEEKFYNDAISGSGFLEYGSLNEFAQKTLKSVKDQKQYDKIKKLKIGNISDRIEELENYRNVEELLIEGNGVSDFTWIAELPELRKLTLIRTSLKDGTILANIPHLDVLFINENSNLLNYEFLKDMRIESLFIGENGKADVTALYDLNNVEYLALEENLLVDMDIRRLEHHKVVDGKRKYMMLGRWIDEDRVYIDINGDMKLPKTYSVGKFLKK